MRILLSVLLGLVVLFLAAWGGVWWYTESQLQAGVQNWVQKYSTAQTQASDDSIARGTSPLAATVTVTNFRLVVQPTGQPTPMTITLPSLTLRIEAATPTVLHLDLPPQISFTTSRGDFAVSFGSADYSSHLDWHALFGAGDYPFTGSDGVFNKVSIAASSGSLTVLTIDQVKVHGQVNRHAGPGDDAVEVQESFDGVALAPMFTHLANIPFNGTITHLGLEVTLSGPLPGNWQGEMQTLNAIPADDRADRMKFWEGIGQAWAAGGGHGKAALSLVVGPSTLRMAGNVKFDGTQQPEGTASVTANHLDAFSNAILNAYPQMQNAVNGFEARMSPYLSSTDADGQLLNMQVVYGSGLVSINGQQVSTLPPLNWHYVPDAAPVVGSGAGQ
jgi:hypothetical protein